MDIFNDLPSILAFSWQELGKAPLQKKHPWRTPVIANRVNGQVSQRTVVLRKAGKKERYLRFYTDLRSSKVKESNEKLNFNWLFYNERKQIQLRVLAKGSVLSVEGTEKIWNNLPVHSRAAYASLQAPGTPVAQPTNGLPADFSELSLAETAYARKNFMVIDTVVETFEFLQLHRQGQRRARFLWREGDWVGEWLIP